jgi:hypothetical protein
MQMPMQMPMPMQMQMPMPTPAPMTPELTMPEYQLETMYPNTYDIIYPEVVHHCDMFDMEKGSMTLPTHEEIERMVDNVIIKVEVEVEAEIRSGMREAEIRESETRQMGFEGRGLLRDLSRILFLREFFQRRHRPHRPRRPFPHHMNMGY